MNGRNIKWILISIGVPLFFIVLVFACFLWLFYLVPPFFSGFVEQVDLDAEAIEALLESAAAEPVGPFNPVSSDPKIENARMQFVLPDHPACWRFFQTAVQRNLNRPVITKKGTDHPRLSGYTVIMVDFDQGETVRFAFYRGALVGCEIGEG